MKLKQNSTIKLKSWLNDSVISDENWEVFSNDETDGILYIFAKCPTTGNQIKFKFEKVEETKEESK